MKLWLTSLRMYSFTASITPVIITYLYILSKGEEKNPLLFILCTFFIILIHSWVNVWNEYYDYKNNVDDKTSNGSTLLIQNNLLSAGFFFVSGIIYFLLSLIFAIYFIYLRGPLLLLFLIPAYLGAGFYTSGVFSAKYHAIGEICVFILLGPLAMLSFEFVYLSEISFNVFILSFIPASLVTAILLVNNIRDIDMDRKADIKTLPMIIGIKNAKYLYTIFILFPYIFVVYLVFSGILQKKSFFIYLTLLIAVKLLYNIFKGNISKADKETAFLHFIAGMLLI